MVQPVLRTSPGSADANKLPIRSRNCQVGVPDDQSVQAMRCRTQTRALVTPEIGYGSLCGPKLGVADDNLEPLLMEKGRREEGPKKQE